MVDVKRVHYLRVEVVESLQQSQFKELKLVFHFEGLPQQLEPVDEQAVVVEVVNLLVFVDEEGNHLLNSQQGLFSAFYAALENHQLIEGDLALNVDFRNLQRFRVVSELIFVVLLLVFDFVVCLLRYFVIDLIRIFGLHPVPDLAELRHLVIKQILRFCAAISLGFSGSRLNSSAACLGQPPLRCFGTD